MATKLFAAARVGDAASERDFIANILKASTEYSITGKNLDGTALLPTAARRREQLTPPDCMPPRTSKQTARLDYSPTISVGSAQQKEAATYRILSGCC
jgi:hypothetical protein